MNTNTYFRSDDVIFWLLYQGNRNVYVYKENGPATSIVPGGSYLSRFRHTSAPFLMFGVKTDARRINRNTDPDLYRAFISYDGEEYSAGRNLGVIKLRFVPLPGAVTNLERTLSCLLADLLDELPSGAAVPAIHFNPSHPQSEVARAAAKNVGFVEGRVR